MSAIAPHPIVRERHQNCVVMLRMRPTHSSRTRTPRPAPSGPHAFWAVLAILSVLVSAGPLRGDEAPSRGDSLADSTAFAAIGDSVVMDSTALAAAALADTAGYSGIIPAGTREILPASTRPFGPGERLEFSVQYGPVNAGSATLEVTDVRDYEGHKVYSLEAKAKSNRFIDKIYKVRNYIQSYMDRDRRYSWRYYEDRREGGDSHRQEVVFDQQKREARYADGTIVPIPAQSQDALSSFYFTRYLPLP